MTASMSGSASDETDSREDVPELLSELLRARRCTDALFELITEEALYCRAIPERHRLAFYMGHLEAFDWNLVCHRVCAQPPLHKRFEELFAFGIDPVDGALPCDGRSEWPELAALFDYRGQARAAIDALLQKPLRQGVLQMAIEHRLMHLETLSYMLPQLPLDSFLAQRIAVENRQPGPSAADYLRVGEAQRVRVIDISAGHVTLGKPRNTAFGWDNEHLEHSVFVPAFAIDARNVTNGEYLRFVQAGGYEDRALWLDEDWQWQQQLGRKGPLLWTQKLQSSTEDFVLRTAFAEVPLPLDWPVSVSLAEARAYLRFAERDLKKRGVRLPSEAEYHRAAYGVPDGTERNRERAFPWGEARPEPLTHGNFGCARYDFCPVGAFAAGDSAFGVADLMGNGWEWTATPFSPFTGFAVDPLYAGYSAPFFDGKHFVIKGASARTDTLFLRRSFRNWFQPHYPYVFATFRGAYDAGVR